jgi:hypothetical protein
MGIAAAPYSAQQPLGFLLAQESLPLIIDFGQWHLGAGVGLHSRHVPFNGELEGVAEQDHHFVHRSSSVGGVGSILLMAI